MNKENLKRPTTLKLVIKRYHLQIITHDYSLTLSYNLKIFDHATILIISVSYQKISRRHIRAGN